MEQNGKHAKMSFSEAMSLGWPMEQAMKEATRHALEIHHKLGQDVVTYRDGKVVVCPAAELLAEFDKPKTQPPD